jgi:hypothetical protein
MSDRTTSNDLLLYSISNFTPVAGFISAVRKRLSQMSAATKNSTTAATKIPADGHQESPLTAT